VAGELLFHPRFLRIPHPATILRCATWRFLSSISLLPWSACSDLAVSVPSLLSRFDGNLTVVTYIKHQWLRNFQRLSIAAYPVNLGKLPTKPSAVCILGRRALRGSDRFSSTVSIRQRHLEKTQPRPSKRDFFGASRKKWASTSKLRPTAGIFRSDHHQGPRPAARRSARA